MIEISTKTANDIINEYDNEGAIGSLDYTYRLIKGTELQPFADKLIEAEEQFQDQIKLLRQKFFPNEENEE